jgi:hypothetical protein
MTQAARRPPSFVADRIAIPFGFPNSGASAESGAAATGTVVCDTNANMADGDTVTISDGFRTLTYEYDKSANGVAAGHIVWTAGSGTAISVAGTLVTAIAANQPALGATNGGTATVTLTNAWAGSGGNVSSTKSSSSALAVTGMSGGVNPGGGAGITSTTTLKLMVTERPFQLESVELISPTGLTQDASNYYVISLNDGATVMASWSTLTTAQGSLTANTFKEMVLSATVANRYTATGDVLSLVMTLHGTQTLPPGTVVVHGLYL